LGLGAEDLGRDLRRGRVRLQEGEERLLDAEIAGIADGVDLRVARETTGGQVGRQEAAVIGLEPGERRRGDIRRECDQQVVRRRLLSNSPDGSRTRLFEIENLAC
jgi:hypothetical protein